MAAPFAHEFAEVDVADLGAVEAAHAGWDGLYGHDVFRWVEPTRPTAVSWRFRIVPGVGGVAPTYAFNRVARAAPPRPQRVPLASGQSESGGQDYGCCANQNRSEEGRVGKECVRTCISRG